MMVYGKARVRPSTYFIVWEGFISSIVSGYTCRMLGGYWQPFLDEVDKELQMLKEPRTIHFHEFLRSVMMTHDRSFFFRFSIWKIDSNCIVDLLFSHASPLYR